LISIPRKWSSPRMVACCGWWIKRRHVCYPEIQQHLAQDCRSMAVRRQAFEQLVAVALDALPRQFRRHMRNIPVVVETAPSRALLEAMELWPDHTLLGLYQGVPLPERRYSYGNVLPDQITIFQQPIEALCRTPEEMQAAVRETVIHEVGHYFGLD